MSPVRLHSTQLGTSGPRVVFLHGLFGQGKNWTSIAKSLADGYRLTLVDLPNHGRSDWTGEVSYAEMAMAVGDLLADRAASEPFAVVGHSMGGKVAMALALLRPELVERLCVVDISPVRYTRLTNFADYVAGMRSLDLGSLPDRTTADQGLLPYVPDETIRSFLLQNLRREGAGWRWQMNLDLLGDHLDVLADWPDLQAEPYLGPTLWVAGAESDYITSDYAAAMRRLFPKTQLLTVKRSGHWVHSAQPAIFTEALRRFLAASASVQPSGWESSR
ncbi:MAG: alpha/beta fold hydrolase [Propionibacteriaceae bacterium]